MTSPREFLPHYIGSSEQDIQEMLQFLNLSSLNELYKHIDSEFYLKDMKLPTSLKREDIKADMSALTTKNNIKLNLIGKIRWTKKLLLPTNIKYQVNKLYEIV